MGETYPVSLRLNGKLCVVIGGGQVATRKVRQLLTTGARIRVVAPQVGPDLADWAAHGHIQLVARSFEPADIEGAAVVIAASDDRSANRAAAAAARQAGALVNVVDDPEECDFIVPAVADLGAVKLAITTSGRSPALARWLRQRLEQEYGSALGELAELMVEVREEVQARFATLDERRAVYERMLNSEALELLRQGRRAEARERIRSCISSP